jgi:hypothetical protein
MPKFYHITQVFESPRPSFSDYDIPEWMSLIPGSAKPVLVQGKDKNSTEFKWQKDVC